MPTTLEVLLLLMGLLGLCGLQLRVSEAADGAGDAQHKHQHQQLLHQHQQAEVWQTNGEYSYRDDVPLVQVYRRCMPKPVFSLLEGMLRAVVEDRERLAASQGRQNKLRHGKVRRVKKAVQQVCDVLELVAAAECWFSLTAHYILSTCWGWQDYTYWMPRSFFTSWAEDSSLPTATPGGASSKPPLLPPDPVALAIGSLFRVAFGELSPAVGAGVAGAEWWVQRRQGRRGIAFHYDKVRRRQADRRRD
jgi:hypothetical protein